MARKGRTYVNVDVEVCIEDHLDEVSTKTLIDELDRRSQKGDRLATGYDSWRDWDRLAEHIVSGDTANAIDLLERLTGERFSARTIQKVLCGRLAL